MKLLERKILPAFIPAPARLIAGALSLCLIFLCSTAKAETATFVMPSSLSTTEINALSTAGDSTGVFLGLFETLALVFDTPFATDRGQNVSIFSQAPANGNVRFTVSIGVYNGGTPTIVQSRNLRAGNTFSRNNLFQQGCSAFGGCDYIEITTNRTNAGATGAEIDYVAIEGEVTEVTSPTPEPSTWALMIAAFTLTGWRLKAMRKTKQPGRYNRLDKADWRYATRKTMPQ